MKTYVLTVSRVFPCTHKRKGDQTYFKDKIEMALGRFERGSVIEHDTKSVIEFWPKIHTIRSNYELWSKRIEKVQKGEAVISVRYWSGKPYHKDDNGIGQVEVCQLDRDSGIGCQQIEFLNGNIYDPVTDFAKNGIAYIKISELSKSDGLSLDDFKEWFKGYDLSKPMAIIHFTKFRY